MSDTHTANDNTEKKTRRIMIVKVAVFIPGFIA